MDGTITAWDMMRKEVGDKRLNGRHVERWDGLVWRPDPPLSDCGCAPCEEGIRVMAAQAVERERRNLAENEKAAKKRGQEVDRRTVMASRLVGSTITGVSWSNAGDDLGELSLILEKEGKDSRKLRVSGRSCKWCDHEYECYGDYRAGVEVELELE